MLLLNNADVAGVLTMEVTMRALEDAYRELNDRRAVCRPRIDIQIPTQDPRKFFNGEPWKAVEPLATSPSA